MDEQALRGQEVYARLKAYASDHMGEISYTQILQELKPHLTGQPKVAAAEKLMRRLLKDGVKVWR
ncbi:MAG: hypothetical protein WC941_06050 [Candidatus Bathyarchaeia archaeon]